MHLINCKYGLRKHWVVENGSVTRAPEPTFNNFSNDTANHRRSAKQHRTCATSAASDQQSVVPPEILPKLEESIAGSASLSDGVKGSPASDGTGGVKRYRTYFPYGKQFRIGEQVVSPRQVIDMLGVFMDDKRKERMAQVRM